MTCALILIVMAIGMRPAATALAEWSRKRPVFPRKPLREFDKSKLVGFQFADDVGLDSAKAVETDEFIEWRLIPTDPSLRKTVVAYLLVHYYTKEGSTPKIPHTPEVCYRQAGNQVTSTGVLDIPLAQPGETETTISAKYVRLSNPDQKENRDICVAYTFFLNGGFSNDREAARLRMAMPWNRATFFAKIECVTRVPSPDALEAALITCKSLLSRAVPELLASHFPTPADIDRAAQSDAPPAPVNSGDGAAAPTAQH